MPAAVFHALPGFFRFGTVLNHILNGAAQLVICDKAAISGGGDLEKMIGQLVSHIEGVNI